MASLEGGEGTSPDDTARSKRIKQWLKDNVLLLVTLSGVFSGVLIGFSLRSLKLNQDAVLLISYPGELFMRVLKLMILPLIVASLIAGSASLNAKMNGKIAIRTLIYFVLTTMFNAFLGIVLVVAIHPGDPGLKVIVNNGGGNRGDIKMIDSLLDLGRNIVPDNIFQAAFQQSYTVYERRPLYHMVERNVNETAYEIIRTVQFRNGTNTMGIVMFCLLFGTVLGTMGDKGRIVFDFFQTVFDVVMKMVTGIMWLTPIGVCSVITGKILAVEDVGLILYQLGRFVVTVAIGVAFYQLVVIQLVYFIIVRRNPYKFYCGLMQPMLTAAAMASTAAALPLTFRTMTERLKVDQRITRFVLPIGCNINMDGTALFLAVSSIFIAQINNIELHFGELFTLFLTTTLASFACASVPSAALVLLLVVLSAINAPTQDVSLLFAIDWFVDRIRTTNNMLGDCYAAAVVEHLSEEELHLADETKSNSKDLMINGHVEHNDTFDENNISLRTITSECGCCCSNRL